MDSNAEKTQLEDLSSAEQGAVSSAVPSDSDTTTPEETSQETSSFTATDYLFSDLLKSITISNDGNLEYVSDEAETFLRNFRSNAATFSNEIKRLISTGVHHYLSLTEKTKDKLEGSNYNYTHLVYDFGVGFNHIVTMFEDIINSTELRKKNIAGINDGGSETNQSNFNFTHLVPGTDTEQPDIDNSFTESIIMFGTLVLTEAVTMYETIGGVGTQASIDGNYSVLEIVKDGDNYYYKIIDNATGKVYYVPVNNQVQFATEYEKIVEIKENAMLLNSTKIGSDNFVKLADPNKIYFVQGETESNGITFYEVVEDGTGETYYIPFSDSIEVTSLDSIGSTTIEPTISTDTNVSNGLNTSGEPAVSAESGTTIIHEEGV